MIKFKELLIEGFGCYVKETKLNLDSPGINIIKGKNGAGKTTQFNALFWCLYGQNLKEVRLSDIPSWVELREKDWNGTRVIIKFYVDSDEYEIARHINYRGRTFDTKGADKLLIYKNGTPVDSLHKVDRQQLINNILGMDAKIFLNSILFGQRMTRLIQAPNEDKRKLLEELFNVEFIDIAKLKGKEKIETLNKEIYRVSQSIRDCEIQIKMYVDRLESIENSEKLFNSKKSARIKDLQERLVKKENEYTITETLLCGHFIPEVSEPKELRETYKQLMKTKASIEEDKLPFIENRNLLNNKNKSHLAEEKKYLRELDGDIEICPTCRQKLPDDKIEETKTRIKNKLIELQIDNRRIISELEGIRQTIELYDVGLDDVKKKIIKVEEEMELSDKQLKNRQRAIDLKTKYENTITNLLRELSDISSQIDEEEKRVFYGEDSNTIKSSIKQLEKDYDKLKIELKDLTDVKSKYEFWVNTGFSNSGVRSYIFNAMLLNLNNSVERYAHRLGLKIVFSIDLTKSTKPFTTEVYKNNINVNYNSLSGGEKQKIDLCLAFAMHDIICMKNDTNILILDEALEGIDTYGSTEEVFELIRFKAGAKTSTFIITHLQELDAQNCLIKLLD